MRLAWLLLAAGAVVLLAGRVTPLTVQAQDRGNNKKTPPPPTPPPAVLWYAPFLSGGGYGSEAHSYVEAIDAALHARRLHQHQLQSTHEETCTAGADAHLHAASDGSGADAAQRHAHDEVAAARPFDLFVTQHGDSYNAVFIRDMPDEMRDRLEEHWIEERDFHWRLRATPVALAVCHSEPGAWHPARYKTSRCPPAQALYTVGRTMFETDRVPSGWAERMNKMDEIWVPTAFQQRIFVNGGVRAEAVHVLPEAVDVHFFDPAAVDAPLNLAAALAGVDAAHHVTPQTTVFLSVFKWEERKGWRILLRAYFEAFTAGEDVALVILTSAYHAATTDSATDFMAIVREFASAELHKPFEELPRVYVLPPQLPQHELPALYKAATAFVLPSRGEGWGRPHVEAMAMALPVIATFWSGTTEYMTEHNSYPLKIDGLVEIQEGAFRGHKWAEPSVSHLTELLQRVHRLPDEAREKGERARADMVAKYAPEVVGQLLLQHIERVLAIVAARQRAHESDESEENDAHDEL